MQFLKIISPFKNLLSFYLIVSLLLRIVLLFHPITQTDFSTIEIFKILFFGLISDILVFVIVSSLLWLYLLFLSNSKLKKPWGYIIFAIYLIVFLYILSGKSMLSEYGGVLPEIGLAFIGVKTLMMLLLLLFPKKVKTIRLALFSITIFIFVLVIIQNTISEFFFWNEFGVRYNFIAVDYLVYTNTVIGNIMESYPIVPLFTTVGILTLIVTYYIVKNSKIYLDNLPTFKNKIIILIVVLLVNLLSLFLIPKVSNLENSNNVFANELQSNGVYKFYKAFKKNELDYYKYFITLSDNIAFNSLKNEISSSEKFSSLRKIKSDSVEVRKNIVLITIESLSAEYLKTYGYPHPQITPFLDSLVKQSLNFSNLYATGNRTVRGLEAVTLCIPPTPGESVIKRTDNKSKFSTASVLKKKGYNVKYLYGGDAYFDNMKDFFGGNGYDIVDKSKLLPNEITFSNIWGVCDEDMANKAISVMNEEAKSGKPFFNHWMTVSNHRPFTYPDGKIKIPSDWKVREGGINYTDYALKQFFKMASKQSWFKNTVFVIVADHCASSSGNTELPLDRYRIPAMIYSPGFITPRNETKLMSQIDLMPTLFGLLNFSYESKFYGQDILNEDYKPRAFIATYQDLGFIKDNTLTILSPIKKVKQFDLEIIPNDKTEKDFQIFYKEKPRKEIDINIENEAISYYQTATYLLKNKKYQAED